MVSMRHAYFILLCFLMFADGTAQQQLSVYCETNQYTLSPSQDARLTDWLTESSAAKVIAIEGYTDEVGTTESNDTLARRRVDHVFDAIKGKVAIRDDFKTR